MVEIVSPLVLEKLKSDEVFFPRQFRVAGFFQIGHQHLDKSTVYGTLRAAQELYGMGKAVHGFNVRLKPGVGDAEGADLIGRQLPNNVFALPWTRSWEAFLWILNLEKTVFFFLLLFIVIIASFSVMSSLVASVVRKTREIGLLGALGGSSSGVAMCFCVQAFLVGVTGTALGVGFGYGVLAVRNEIVQGIAGAMNRSDTLKNFYQFTDLPAHTETADLLAIVITAIVISTLAGLVPAWRAARLKPVEALRSE
jgi:lipoprotein-releasing system permease protein